MHSMIGPKDLTICGQKLHKKILENYESNRRL